MRLYCIYDRVSCVHGEHTGLNLMRSDDVAKRAFKSALKAKQLPPTILDYPGDFDLICLGDFDQAKGLLIGEAKTVCNLKTLLEVPE